MFVDMLTLYTDILPISSNTPLTCTLGVPKHREVPRITENHREQHQE